VEITAALEENHEPAGKLALTTLVSIWELRQADKKQRRLG
jgi:hypothetical protein